jgi:hypothetical protein
LEENFEKVFSRFITIHDYDVLYFFWILLVDFIPTCLQLQNFDSQQGGNMDVNEFQFVPKTSSTYVSWTNIYILFLYCLFSWIASNLT